MSEDRILSPSEIWINVTNLTDVVTSGANEASEEPGIRCGNESAPATYVFLSNLTERHLALLAVYVVSVIVTVALYVDEIVFVARHFRRDKTRTQKTIWVLAVFPVFALTGLLGYVVPLAVPILDLAANTFMATCLYNMMELMMNYLGGSSQVWTVISEGQLSVNYATLPVCCLLPCLPAQRLNRSLLTKLRALVLQVCVLRPILMFIAAVMWANGTYNHSGLDLKTADPYINVINATTTILAVYGLNLLKTAFVAPLASFLLGGKIFILQMVLATCSLTPGFTKLFRNWGLVVCDPVYRQPVHLDAIYRGVLVISMLIYAIGAWFLFRRKSDADTHVERYDAAPDPEPDMDLRARLCHVAGAPRRVFRAVGKRVASGRRRESSLDSEEEQSLSQDQESQPKRNNSHCNGFVTDDINQNGGVSVHYHHGDVNMSLTLHSDEEEEESSFGVNNSTLTNSNPEINV